MNDCLFCKIISGAIPSAKIYEDDEVLAFLDIKPVNPGHALVIPKAHTDRLAEMTDDAAASLMRVVPYLSKAIMKAVGAEAFNLMCNNGDLAGQTIDHVHLHIIPRFDGDGYEAWHGSGDLPQDEVSRIANAIRQNL